MKSPHPAVPMVDRDKLPLAPRDEQLRIILQWFRARYRAAEGKWLLDETYDSAERLQSEFRGLVGDDVIRVAVRRIERSGVRDWIRGDDGPSYSEDDPGPELDAGLDDRDDDEDEYDERIARQRVLDRISTLERELAEIRKSLKPDRPASIGHNRPPEDIDEPSPIDSDIAQILASMSVIKAEATKPLELTAKTVVATEVAKIETASKGWLKERGKKALDSTQDWAVKGGWTTLGGGVFYIFAPKLQELAHMIQHWLHLIP